jgi:hypothetical protein
MTRRGKALLLKTIDSPPSYSLFPRRQQLKHAAPERKS